MFDVNQFLRILNNPTELPCFIILCTPIILIIWHFKFQIPRDFTLIKGKVESCGSIISPLNRYEGQRLRNITFLQDDGTRIAFSSLTLKIGLWRHIKTDNRVSLLSGHFCLMKQFGRVFFFAYASADNATKIAVSNDLYFPKMLSKLANLVRFVAISIVTYLALTVFIHFYDRIDDDIFFDMFFILMEYSFSLVFLYYFYFNFISQYPKKAYEKQKELLEKSGIPIPII